MPAFCGGIGFNYLTFPSTGSQAPCRWQVLINVTLGSVMISSHDTPYSPSLSLCLSSHIFNFISPNVSISVVIAGRLAAPSFLGSFTLPVTLSPPISLYIYLFSASFLPSHMLLSPCPFFTFPFTFLLLSSCLSLSPSSLLESPITLSLPSCLQPSILLV